MSPWLQQLRDASFRGVPFLVDKAQNGGGRRSVLTEFPLRDDPQVDDLGRKAREFTITAYVIGPDYMPARDALIEALEKAGPGDLVHPWLGDLRVQIGEISWEESTREGGYCTFSIPCYLASPVVYPRPRPDTQATVASSVEDAQAAAEEAFAESCSVEGYPEFVTESLVDQVKAAVQQVRDLAQALTTLPEELTELVQLVDDVSAAVGELAAAPLVLAGKLTAVFNQLQVAVTRPFATLEALAGLFGFGNDQDEIEPTTPSREQQAINQAALSQFVQQLATLAAASSASQADYASLDDAVAARTQLLEQLDVLTESGIDDQLYQALGAVRTNVAEDLRRRGADLARLVRLELPESTPSLVLAWRLYGDAGRAQELVDRNRVASPLFMPAGQPLEALNE